LTGKTKLKAPEAYDVIKKLLQFDRGALEEKKKDPILGEVYQQAVHSRNGPSKKRRG